MLRPALLLPGFDLDALVKEKKAAPEREKQAAARGGEKRAGKLQGPLDASSSSSSSTASQPLPLSGEAARRAVAHDHTYSITFASIERALNEEQRRLEERNGAVRTPTCTSTLGEVTPPTGSTATQQRKIDVAREQLHALKNVQAKKRKSKAAAAATGAKKTAAEPAKKTACRAKGGGAATVTTTTVDGRSGNDSQKAAGPAPPVTSKLARAVDSKPPDIVVSQASTKKDEPRGQKARSQPTLPKETGTGERHPIKANKAPPTTTPPPPQALSSIRQNLDAPCTEASSAPCSKKQTAAAAGKKEASDNGSSSSVNPRPPLSGTLKEKALAMQKKKKEVQFRQLRNVICSWMIG